MSKILEKKVIAKLKNLKFYFDSKQYITEERKSISIHVFFLLMFT